jgi:hypothetical protein
MAAAAAELIDLTASDGEDEREKPAWTCAGCVRVRCAGGAPALATSLCKRGLWLWAPSNVQRVIS